MAAPRAWLASGACRASRSPVCPSSPSTGRRRSTAGTRRSGSGSRATYPYTRGVYPSMYTGRPWTMRQYAGFGTATESNERYHQLVEAGTSGLSVAFDLPTQMGYDSDDPRGARRGRQGRRRDRLGRRHAHAVRRHPARRGVDVDDDQRAGRAAAAALPAGRRGAGRRPGAADRHDPERRAQGVHRPRHLHLPAAAVAAADHRHLRLLPQARSRAGTPSRSPATTWPRPGRRPRRRSRSRWPTRVEYVRAALAAGLAVDDFAPRLSFFFVARTTLLEEVAKFRAARRIWAQVMRDEFGAQDPKSLMLRFHTQTAGVQLTAQQPEVNLVRVTVQALGRGARRHPVAAHQLLRRGDRAADREGGPAGAADPAGDRVRDRRDRDRRPVRRLVRGRVDDRRARGGDPRADGRRSRSSAARSPPSRRATRSARSRSRRTTWCARSRTARAPWWASTGSPASDRGDVYEPLRVDPTIEAAAGASGSRPLRAERDSGRGRPAPRRRCGPPPRAPTTCSTRCTTRCGPGPPSARSATCCARSGASTTPPTRSDRGRR